MLEVELAAQQACVAYHRNVVLRERLLSGREEMGRFVRSYYADRLRLPGPDSRADGIRAILEDPNAVLVEMAHDGQLPHLGIVRLVLKARQIAAGDPNGLALYLVGDHYSAEMRPENLYLGLPLRGVDADQVKSPLTVPVGRKMRHVPFRWLPPPSPSSLDELERRADAWLVNNAAHVRSSAFLPAVRETARARFDLLRESASRTQSFGDWLARVQVCLLDDLYGAAPSQLAVLPMSAIVEWVPDVVGDLLLDRPSGQEAFWIHCPTCHRRYRPGREGDSFRADCRVCGRAFAVSWPRDADRFMPDIVAFQMALFRAGIAGWLVGSHAEYHPVIEEGYRRRFGIESPPTFFLTSIPRFVGVGEPPEGHTRARLLRVLFEMDPTEVRRALEAPWTDDPVLRSPYLEATRIRKVSPDGTRNSMAR